MWLGAETWYECVCKVPRLGMNVCVKYQWTFFLLFCFNFLYRKFASIKDARILKFLFAYMFIVLLQMKWGGGGGQGHLNCNDESLQWFILLPPPPSPPCPLWALADVLYVWNMCKMFEFVL